MKKMNKNIFICALLVAMMLLCVSAVSAEDNMNADLSASDEIDAAVDSADTNDIKESETLAVSSEGSSSDEILTADDNTVTNETFFNYFDESGVINKSISYDELTFNGTFSDLGIDTITIDTPITISGSDAIFTDIGFKIVSENVTLTNFEIKSSADGTAIDISADNVTVEGVTIDMDTVGKADSYAIRASESNYLNLLNNIITFNAGYAANYSVIRHALDIKDCDNFIIKGNTIIASLPALDVNWYASGISQDLPLAVGIENGENSVFTGNAITVNTTKAAGDYPTLDSMMVYGVSNLTISDNDFIQTDFSGEGKAGYSNVVDLYSFDGITVSGNNILVNTTTGSEGAGTAYAIQATGSYTDLVIDGNDLTSVSKGPALGIYSQNYNGVTDITVSNNVIDVTGYATDNAYALVSGMELQDTVAVVYGNDIVSKAINSYNESNNLYGISYAQYTSGNHTYNITGNNVLTYGKYAVYIRDAVDSSITENVLYAEELSGDDAVVISGDSNVVENNYPPFDAEIVIDSPAVWTGNNGNISVTVANATGNVTIKIGNKTYEDLELVNGTVSQEIDADDLTDGANAIEVTYTGDDNLKAGTQTGNLQVISGVVTAETFQYYFDADNDNYLSDAVPEGATLDFQGSFISSNYSLYINKPVNVISSTDDAVFDSNTTNRQWIKFNVVEGGNHTNITGISIINGDLFIQGASYVTVDDIYMKANMSGVGAGTGFISIHSNAYYTTVMNSYFENGGTGSSCLVLGKGGKYATFDNNYFNITGSSGNVLSSNVYVGSGEIPQAVNYTNNVIESHVAGSMFMYGITVCGEGNIIENNTLLNFKGNGIVNQWGATSTKNVYRNNTITGGGAMVTGTYSIVEDNYLEGALTVTAGSNVTGNTAKTMTISGANAQVYGNTINGAVTIAAAAKNTTFDENYLTDALTVNSNDNVITYNQISTENSYAVDLKSTTGNTVRYNVLSSADKMGDDAVSYVEDNNNTVKNNGMNAIINIDVADSWSGNNNTIAVTVVNATGTVTIKVNNKEFDAITLVDGAATLEVDASDIETGLNNVTVSYSGNKVISADSKVVTFYGLDNVVYTEVFFDFFDEDGNLKDDVPYTDLIFKGAFAKASTVKYIYINRPLNISSDDASFNLMGIVIESDDVAIDGLTLTASVNSVATSLGDLISVKGNNVVLSNLNINYKVTYGNYNAIAINVVDADNVGIYNNTIIFESAITSDEYDANAINLEGVTNAVVDNNTITTSLPGLFASNYDEDYFLMGLNTVNPVRVKEVTNLTFTNNGIESKVKKISGSYPTVQSLFVIGTENAVFAYNDFKMIDTVSKTGSYTYLYAFVFGYDTNISVLYNNFELSTKSGVDSAGGAYALQGVESEIAIIGNNITTFSYGPNLGIYICSMYGGSSETYISDNIINVTGYANSTSALALVSGVEIQNGNAYIYNNTIYVYNNAGFVAEAPVYGVSYAQYMYGDRSLDVQDNFMVVQGNYTVSVLDGTLANVTDNILYAEELFGDDSVAPGYDGIVENNTPPFDAEIIIDPQAVWTGSNSTITVTVPNATGNVTIVIGNKTFKEVALENGTVTVDVDAEYLVDGSNDVDVTYNGDLYIKTGNATANLEVLYGVITNETFKYYFDADNNNYLFDYVPENTVLDFQGSFIGGDFTLYINKPENIVSTTGDAVFDSGANPNYNWFKFNVVAGANHTNITGISIINGDLFIQGASYVTVDDIYMNANMKGVGAGTGFISIHSNAYYTTVKNSYFENGGTGSSCLVLGKGGKYATFDNNYFNITGSSGNVLSSNVYVGSGEIPQAVNYTNNVIESHVAGSMFMYGITVCGEGNIIENNTLINFTGNAIVNQWGAASTKNIYRNNTITGGGAMAVGTYSIVENNYAAESALTVTEGCTFANNTVKSVTISGKNVVADNNLILSTATVSAAATNTTFTNNVVNGLVTVNSAENTITDNIVISDTEYAVDLKSTANNTVTDNILYASELVGDAAVNYDNENNTVSDNYPVDPVLVVEAADITVGENATINILFNENVTGDVEVIVNGKKYTVDVTDGEGQLNVSDLFANKYTVGVSYEGSLLYIATENSTVFTVAKLESEANVTIPSDIAIGDDVTVTVDIPGATGNVSVIVDGVENVVALDENGTATYTIPAVGAGDHSVVVAYAGDDENAPVIKTAAFSVDKETAQANITIPSDIAIGDDVTVTVDIPGATGNVSVIVDGVENVVALDENGTATYTIPAVGAGDHSVVVAYAGDDEFAPVIETAAFSLDKETAQANITIPSDIDIGDDVTVTVDIPGATGNVSVIVDGVENVVALDENGTATYTIPEISGGEHSVVVVYDGDESHDSAYNMTTIYLEEYSTQFINLTVSGDLVITGVLANSLGDVIPNATITYSVDDVSGNLTTGDDGSFTIIGENNAEVSIDYAGSNIYLGTNVVLSLDGIAQVRSGTLFNVTDGFVLTVYAVDYSAGERGDYFNVLLTDTDGNPLVNQSVVFAINGWVHNKTTDENGVAHLQINLAEANKYTVAPCYLGNTTYNATFASAMVKVVKKPITISASAKSYKASVKTKKYTVTLKTKKCSSADGKTYLKSGKKVTLKVNGKTYTAKINAKGQVTFKITNLSKKATYKAVIKFAGDKTYEAASKTVKIKVK